MNEGRRSILLGDKSKKVLHRCPFKCETTTVSTKKVMFLTHTQYLSMLHLNCLPPEPSSKAERMAVERPNTEVLAFEVERRAVEKGTTMVLMNMPCSLFKVQTLDS